MAEPKFTCQSCIYWVDETVIGTCRRFPVYQHRSRAEWCGEYRAPVLQQIVQHQAPAAPAKRKYVRRNNAQAAA